MKIKETHPLLELNNLNCSLSHPLILASTIIHILQKHPKMLDALTGNWLNNVHS